MKYIRNWSVLCCPADEFHKYRPNLADDKQKDSGRGIAWTYTINGSCTIASESGVDRTDADKRGMKLNVVRQASKTVMLVDENADHRKEWVSINDALFIGEDRVADRHPGKQHEYIDKFKKTAQSTGMGNVTYLDGHIGTIPGMLMWQVDYYNKQCKPMFARN